LKSGLTRPIISSTPQKVAIGGPKSSITFLP
jgi:hypothetical protein